MLNIIYGDITKLPIRNLISDLKKCTLDGILYVGYPIIDSLDDKKKVDALLICKEHGLVIFDLETTTFANDDYWSKILAEQDDLYANIERKLLGHREMRKGRSLAITINIITYLPPTLSSPSQIENLTIATSDNLDKILANIPPIERTYLTPLKSIIQNIIDLKPKKKRSSVKQIDSKGAILKQIEAKLAELDQWQNQAAIESPQAPQRIRGLAGSGKTVVLALKAAYLHVSHPEWTICVTFQTRSLHQQFEDFIRRFTFQHINDEPDWSKIKILHAWGGPNQAGVYYELALANGITPRNFAYASREYGWPNAFEGVCQEFLAQAGKDINPIYDVLLIDEAQDFPQSFFQLVYKSVPEPKWIVWAYDELQNLGDYEMLSPEKLFGVTEKNKPRVTLYNHEDQPQQDIILPICYRNPPWTLATAHALGFGIYREKGLCQYFDDEKLWYKMGYQIIAGQLLPGQPVTLARRPDTSPAYFKDLLTPNEAVQCHIFENRDEQATWVAAAIKHNLDKDELEASDILIILPNAYTTQSDAVPIMQALRREGLKTHLVGITSSKDELLIPDSIAITHIYRAKGNEAPMVYALNSQSCFEGPELSKRRNRLFTAITRSRGWVHICGHGAAMQDLEAEIKHIRENDFKLTFTVPTPKQLARMKKVHGDMSKREQEKLHKVEDVLKAVAQGEINADHLPRELRQQVVNALQTS